MTALFSQPLSQPLSYEQLPSFPLPETSTPKPALGRGIELLGRVAPGLSGRLLWKLWFTPFSIAPNARARELLATVEQRFEVYSGDEGVEVLAFGQGPTVLLAHGWSTYGAQLGSFVRPLVAAGYRVLLFDAPGHGGKARREFRLDQYAQLLRDIIQHAGGVHAIVAHSLGASAAAITLHELKLPARLVLLAPSANLKTVLQSFQHKLGLGDASIARLRRRFDDFFGADVWPRYSLDHHLPSLAGPVLLVHDHGDSEAPVANTLYLRERRPDAQLLLTEGLGHNRILHDAAVVAAVTQFVTAPARAFH